MVKALRLPDTYELISEEEWRGIRATGLTIALEKLAALKNPRTPVPARGKGRTTEWYERNYPKTFNEAVQEFEKQEPILTYCAGSWKVKAVFRIVLRRLKDGTLRDGDSEESEGEDLVDDKGANPAEELEESTPKSTSKKRPRRSSGSPHKKQKPSAHGPAVPPVPPGPQQEEGVLDNSQLDNQVSKPLAQGPANGDEGGVGDVVDISFIQVDHSRKLLANTLHCTVLTYYFGMW